MNSYVESGNSAKLTSLPYFNDQALFCLYSHFVMILTLAKCL